MNAILDLILIILNIIITYKIIRSFRIFDFHQAKAILRWIYLITVSMLVSYCIRLYFNFCAFFGSSNLPVKDMDLDGVSKMTHMGIITVIELLP